MSETTWRLAPAEATEEMAVRAFQTVDLALAAVEMGPCDQYRYAYRASLAAAPKPPAGLYVVSEDGTARRVEVDVWAAIDPFVALLNRQEDRHRKRGGNPDKFPDTHPSFDTKARDLPMGVWRQLRALHRALTGEER